MCKQRYVFLHLRHCSGFARCLGVALMSRIRVGEKLLTGKLCYAILFNIDCLKCLGDDL